LLLAAPVRIQPQGNVKLESHLNGTKEEAIIISPWYCRHYAN
jgi:hypothetical protein